MLDACGNMGSTGVMPAEMSLFEACAGDGPLVVAAPHVGTFVPPAIAKRLNPAGLAVGETDFHVHRLFDFARDMGASTIFATHSRYVIDLNRDPDGQTLYPGRFETGLCPLSDFDRQPIYAKGQEPDSKEIQQRLEHYWRPYHNALRAALDRAVARHGRALLIDAHSIRGVIPSLFDGRLPDLNFGSDGGRTLSPPLVESLNRWRKGCGQWSHVLDGRFRGGYTTRHYGEPARGVEALQIEIVQDTYLDTATPHLYDPAIAAPLSSALRPLVTALVEALPSA